MPSYWTTSSVLTLSLLFSHAFATVATSPVLNAPGNWGAPCLIQVPGDGFYSFATINSLAHVPIAFSKDFETWNIVATSNGDPIDAMPYLPSWVDQNNPGIWGPDVNLLDNGTYIMYFAGQLANGGIHCLGYAYSNTIAGPYIPHNQTWFCPGGGDQSIDPDGFHDPSTGKRYVTYKWNQASLVTNNTKTANISGCGPQQPPYPPTPIMIQEVDVDGFTKIGNASELVDNRGDSDCGNTESPSMMMDSFGNYVIYFSTGYFQESTYTVSYAVSNTSVYGPYTRAAEPFFQTGEYNMLGPGTADVLNTGLYMVLFAQNLNQPNNSNREMRTALISVAANQTVLGNGTLPNGGSSNGGSSPSSTSTSRFPRPSSTATSSMTLSSIISSPSGTSDAVTAVDFDHSGLWTLLVSTCVLSMAIMLIT